jgi:hypothetical protein
MAFRAVKGVACALAVAARIHVLEGAWHSCAIDVRPVILREKSAAASVVAAIDWIDAALGDVLEHTLYPQAPVWYQRNSIVWPLPRAGQGVIRTVHGIPAACVGISVLCTLRLLTKELSCIRLCHMPPVSTLEGATIANVFAALLIARSRYCIEETCIISTAFTIPKKSVCEVFSPLFQVHAIMPRALIRTAANDMVTAIVAIVFVTDLCVTSTLLISIFVLVTNRTCE